MTETKAKTDTKTKAKTKGETKTNMKANTTATKPKAAPKKKSKIHVEVKVDARHGNKNKDKDKDKNKDKNKNQRRRRKIHEREKTHYDTTSTESDSKRLPAPLGEELLSKFSASEISDGELVREIVSTSLGNYRCRPAQLAGGRAVFASILSGVVESDLALYHSINSLVEYYARDEERVELAKVWKGGVTNLEKLLISALKFAKMVQLEEGGSRESGNGNGNWNSREKRAAVLVFRICELIIEYWTRPNENENENE